MYIGDYDPSAILDKKNLSFGTAPVTLGGTPTVGIFKSNSTAFTTLGVTLTTDFGGRTGSNHLRADLSQDTAFYAAGNDFDALFLTGTVGGTPVAGLPIISFSVQHRAPLLPAVAGRKLGLTAGGEVTATVLGNVTGSVASVTGAVGSVAGAVGSVGSNVTAVVSGNITGSVANLTNITGPVTVTTNLDKGGYTAAVSGNITGSVANLTNITGPVTVTTVLDKTGYTSSVSGNVTGTVARVTLTDTLTTYTGNTLQTGDSFARIGAAGIGLTSLPALFTTSTMTESYAADGAAMSPAQALHQIWALVNNFSISGTAYQSYRLDGTTTAMLHGLDSATSPTALNRVG